MKGAVTETKYSIGYFKGRFATGPGCGCTEFQEPLHRMLFGRPFS